MKIIFLIALVWGWTPGCNDVANNGQSQCFQQWKSNKKEIKQALQCCMNYREGDYNHFNVPIIVLPSLPSKTEFRACRASSSKNCQPSTKCSPESVNDIEGFFNFLDLYRKIPFPDYYPEQTKSLNWECFNSNDNLSGYHHQSLQKEFTFNKRRSGRVTIPETRFNDNFCRSLIYEYHKNYGPKVVKNDICESTKIFPYQRNGRLEFSEFNPNGSNQYLKSRISINQSLRAHVSDKGVEFIPRKCFRKKYYNISTLENALEKNITIFQNFYDDWRSMGVQFQEDHSSNTHRKRRKEFKNDVLMKTNCGCFAK